MAVLDPSKLGPEFILFSSAVVHKILLFVLTVTGRKRNPDTFLVYWFKRLAQAGHIFSDMLGKEIWRTGTLFCIMSGELVLLIRHL